MRKRSNLPALIAKSVGSTAAFVRAMERTSTPINYRTAMNWCNSTSTIKVSQLINIARVLNLPLCEIINEITIKTEGDE
jgi:hypothetical protein